MSPTTTTRTTALLALLLTALPTAARAELVEEGTRIAVQAGWAWAPNSGFEASAAEASVPLARTPFGGPALTGVFGYQVSPAFELALEVGAGVGTLAFQDKPTSFVLTVPLVVAVRWFVPTQSKLTPYLGAGGGYYLNFFSGGAGSFESHTSGFFGAAGALLPIGERTSLVGEARYTLATAGFPGIGGLNVGGASLSFGVQLTFPPERNELR